MRMKIVALGVALVVSALCGGAEMSIPLGERGTVFPKGSSADTSAWTRVSCEVPAAWKGRRVVFSVPWGLNKCDLVLHVNGERAGDVLRPAGRLDVTDRVRFGEVNDFAWVLTESGRLTARGEAKTVAKLHRARKGLSHVPELVSVAPVSVSDVFANTSWRRKQADFEVEIDACFLSTQRRGDAKISIEVLDSVSNVVWRGEKKVQLRPGVNKTTLSMPWDEKIVPWELGRPALYWGRAVVTTDGASGGPEPLPKDGSSGSASGGPEPLPKDGSSGSASGGPEPLPKAGSSGSASGGPEPMPKDVFSFSFGFREVWRDGKDIMMNGHKAHLRPTYSYGANLAGAKYLADIGYNILAYCHTVDAFTAGPDMLKRLDDFDRLGMGVFISCGGGPNIVRDRAWDDSETEPLYRDFQRTFQRLTRNHPCIIAEYVTQMIICDIGAHDPLKLGQTEADGPRDRLINLFAKVNREYNPNVLYYSHADGNNGDIASGNLYLNWTPLQEREEWLSKWAKDGVLPWCSVEFGQPYDGCWYWQRIFLETEHLAQHFGDRAYAEEPADVLPLLLAAGAGNKTGHGSKVGGEIIPTRFPLFWELRRLWTWRTNSRWRAYGHGGGNIYFNLREAYGTPPGTKGYGRYGEMKEEVPRGVKPPWANEAWNIHQLGNKDFCAFIGGAPDFADRTHAYRAGERVEKQLVMVWDGLGKKNVEVRWRLMEQRAEGKSVLALEGTVRADVLQGEVVKVKFSFDAPDVRKRTDYRLVADFGGEASDEMELEVFPRRAATAAGETVALFDPSGESEPVLRAAGVAYRKVSDPARRGGLRALVIGRNALSKSPAGVAPEEVEAGLRVLILAQSPETWQALGFKVQDTMEREVFPRAAAFKALPPHLLDHWRGAPRHGDAPYGRVMAHSSQRGPRWTRRHVVAGLVLETPPRIGFAPLMEAGCDMAYSPLLRFSQGKGSVTFCTLDFEGRAGACPAATAAARAVFADFLAPAAVAGRPPYRGGDGRAGSPLPAAAKTWTLAADFCASGRVYRAKAPAIAEAACAGPGLFRWSAAPVTGTVKGGSFALDPAAFRAAAASAPEDERQMYLFNAMRAAKLLARLNTAAGAKPDPQTLRRILHLSGGAAYSPLPALHVLGPFAAKDDSKTMLDTVWTKEGERMAVSGDFNPNVSFDLPQGGRADWRPFLSPDAEGRFDFTSLHPSVASSVEYAIAVVPRRRAGRARFKLGVDWRVRVWVNGEEAFRADAGAHYPKFEFSADLKAGDNVIAFKVGGGRSGCRLWALIENERLEDSVAAEEDSALDAVSLYDELVPGFDPYAFHYW